MLAIIAAQAPSQITKLLGNAEDCVFYRGPQPTDTEALKQKILFVLFKSRGNIKIVDGKTLYNEKGWAKTKMVEKNVFTLFQL